MEGVEVLVDSLAGQGVKYIFGVRIICIHMQDFYRTMSVFLISTYQNISFIVCLRLYSAYQ